jgi:single-strand DNA-binding protein
MPSYNSITIVGNSGSDGEMRFTPNGTAITSFNVAVDNGRYVDEVWKPETEWFRIICLNKLAERVNEKVLKGMPVLVIGKVKLNRWQDRNNGEMKASLEILASKVVTFAKSEKTFNAPAPISDDEVPPEEDIDPDIPF